ncbi:MAG: hypothetical protein ACK559_40655, partial [bacterium]
MTGRVAHFEPGFKGRTEAGPQRGQREGLVLAGGERPDVDILAGEDPAVDGDGNRDRDWHRPPVDFFLDQFRQVSQHERAGGRDPLAG